MSDRTKEIRSKLSAASYIIENLPEYPGYNGSAFVIDDIEKERIVKDLDEAIAFVEAAQAQAGDGEPEAAQDKVIAGALFDFLGFLTTRDKPTAFGATRNASPAVKLLQEWANKRGLDLDGADVEGWCHGAKGE